MFIAKFQITDKVLRLKLHAIKLFCCRKDFENMPRPFRKLFDDHFILSKEFKATGITDVETGLINAILGVNFGEFIIYLSDVDVRGVVVYVYE